MVTAKADDETRVKLLRDGAQDYLLKPFVAEELRTRVGNLVALKRSREELEARNAGLAGMAARLEIETESLGAYSADSVLLRQVCENLMSNALKYSRGRDLTVIEVGTTKKDGEAEVVHFIRDNGAGFDSEQAPNLFGMFQRMHAAKEFEGHGVGLASVKRIIERHGGRIWVEAAKGKGATFYFTLPCDTNGT